MVTDVSNQETRQQLSSNVGGGDDDSDTAMIEDNARNSQSFRTTEWRNVVTVGILCFVNLINYMDRYTVAGVLTDIQSHLNVDDDQGGLLQTCFVISYMMFAPLFGYLGDRYSRTRIMAAGIIMWSLTTLIGSFMNTFGWFVFFRGLVGIGEASYSTIAPTIISDLFVKDLRSKMLALFYFAIPVGSGLGYIVGAETAKAFGGWQWALRVTPGLGFIAVILMLFVLREPERGQAEGFSHASTTSYLEDIRSLIKNPSFMLSTAGFTCVAFVAGAMAWWGPKFIYLGLKLQSHSESASFSEVSLNFGVISLLSGVIGVPMGVYIGEALVHKFPQTHPVICGVGLLTSVPFTIATLWMMENSAVMPLVLLFFAELALNVNWAIVADILLYVVAPNRRSTAEAFQILLSHTFGDAGSPYLIGVISVTLKAYLSSPGAEQFSPTGNNPMMSTTHESDYVNFKSLQYALFLTTFVEVLGGIFFLINAVFIVRDKLKVENEISATTVVQPTHWYAEEVQQNGEVAA